MMPLPPHSSNYTGYVRGFWFIAPTQFTITGVRVPLEAGTGTQNIQIFRISGGGVAAFPAIGTNYTSLFYVNNAPNGVIQTVNLNVNAGDTIGILGQAGLVTSYSPSTPSTSTIGGLPVSLGRFIYQGNINIAQAPEYSSEASGSIGRVEMYYSTAPCSGAPTAGTLPATQGVCPNIAFTLTATGATQAGSMVGQWQSRVPVGTGTWTNIPGASFPNYTNATGITTPTDYRFIITCTPSNLSDTTTVLTTSINPMSQCYCNPGTTTTSYYINDFTTTGGVTNISNLNSGYSTGGYGDFTASDTVGQVHGSSVNFSGIFNTGTYGAKIWVDWNQNGSFLDPGEQVYVTSSYVSSLTGSITVPATAVVGPTRMRIGANWLSSTGPATPCEIFTYGEYEDYTFNVMALENCNTATFPTSATVTSNMDTICVSGDINLNLVTTIPPVANLAYQWQTSTAASGPWTDVGPSLTTPPYTATGVNSDRFYRVQVKCNSVVKVTSDPLPILISNPQVLTALDGQHCGPGTVVLTGTPGGNSSLYWYADATGGSVLGSGNSFTTPFLNETDTFYVAAGIGSGSSSQDSLNSMNGGGNGCGGGVMFDLIGISTVGIDSFKAAATGSGSIIKVYIKNGTYLGNSTNSAAWTLHETINTNYNVGDVMIPLTTPIPISSGDTTGIYIMYNANYANGTAANQTVTNADMIMKAGYGLCSEFGGLNDPRVFNGIIYYGNSGCESARDTVIAHIRPFPDVDLGNDIDACVSIGTSFNLDAGTYPNNPTYLWQDNTTNQSRQVSTSGDYSVIVTNEFGCSGTDTVNVHIKLNPVVNLGNDTTICVGETLTLDAGNQGISYFWNTGEVTPTITVDQTGTYNVIVTNAEGCIGQDTILVITDGVTPTSNGLHVTNTGPKTFKFKAVNPTNDMDYDWDFGDGSVHSSSPNPSHTYFVSGNFLVKLKILGTCGYLKDSTYVSILGIDDLKNDNNLISIYPNPTTGKATILSLEDLRMNQISIYNTLGQQVFVIKVDKAKQVEVDLKGLATGLYTVQIRTDKGNITRKLELLK